MQLTDSLVPVDAEQVRLRASKVLKLLSEREARLWAKTIAKYRVRSVKRPWWLGGDRAKKLTNDEIKRKIMLEENRFPPGFFWFSKEADRCEKLVKATGVITRVEFLLTVDDLLAINLKPWDPDEV